MSILGALSACGGARESHTGCMTVADDVMECPAPGDVDPGDLSIPMDCDGLEIDAITGPGKRRTIVDQNGTERAACCYPVEAIDPDPNAECVVGRPYFDAGSARVAPLRRVRAPSRRAGSARAAAWAKAGAGEHASVAAFARLALQLLRYGAPNDLVAAVHRAALDELRHAELCWSLAERFDGRRVRAGAFPVGTGALGAVTPGELVAATVREGCLSETLAAHAAAAAAELTRDALVRRPLASIARDEARHAVLSYRIAAWALCTGGSEAQHAARAALSQPWPRLDVNELALRAGVDRAALDAAVRRGVGDVLEPAVAGLLAVAA